MALINRPINPNQTLIYNSDRGIQYTFEEFVSELNKYKPIIRSMSRNENCWDNAVAESFFKTLKVELIYQNRYQTNKKQNYQFLNILKLFTIQTEDK
jgi:putative transposase